MLIERLEELSARAEARRDSLRSFRKPKQQTTMSFNPSMLMRSASKEASLDKFDKMAAGRRGRSPRLGGSGESTTSHVCDYGVDDDDDDCCASTSKTGTPDSIMSDPFAMRPLDVFDKSNRLTKEWRRLPTRAANQMQFSASVVQALEGVTLKEAPPDIDSSSSSEADTDDLANTAGVMQPSPMPQPAATIVPSADHVGRKEVDHTWSLQAMVLMMERHNGGSQDLDLLDLLESMEDEDEPSTSLLPVLGVSRGRLPHVPEVPLTVVGVQ